MKTERFGVVQRGMRGRGEKIMGKCVKRRAAGI
jgi:hypothetical protein